MTSHLWHWHWVWEVNGYPCIWIWYERDWPQLLSALWKPAEDISCRQAPSLLFPASHVFLSSSWSYNYFKRYRFFVHRLALYLTSAAIFYSIATALQSVPGDLFGIQNHHLCIAVGFLSQYGSWVLLLYIYWVISQLLLLSVCHVSTKKAEPFIVLLPVLLPIPISCIPFIHNLYGSAGAWCWIVTATADCEKVYAGQIEQFVLWYGPMFLASLGSVIVTLTNHGAVQRSLWDQHHPEKRITPPQ